MPQLDFGNPLTIAQVVWMLLIFGGLYMLLSRWALPQVAEVVDARTARIGADLDTARAAKTEADDAAAEIAQSSACASAEAQSRINAAIAHAKAEAGEQARAANERLDAQLAEAEQRISAARQSAMGALRQVATEAAGVVVNRLIGQQPDQAAVQAAVDRALAARAA